MSTDIQTLVAKRDGATLKALASDGDHDAALAFAQLVFDAKYAGDTSVCKTKKEAKETAREDAFAFIQGAVEAGHYESCAAWAQACFDGVREPGNFGSVLRTSFYGEAEVAYDRLLNHPECPEQHRGAYLVGKAQSIQFKSKIKGIDRSQEFLDLMVEAANTEGHHQALAHFCLSSHYWQTQAHEKAIDHAHRCIDEHPYAALTLSQAYQHGKGVEQDLEKSREYYDLWKLRTEPKRKSKKT